MSHYTYEKLLGKSEKAFRLFKLYPGPPEAEPGAREPGLGELQGELLVRRLPVIGSNNSGTLKDAEPYDALSYVWGEQETTSPTIKILENGRTHIMFIRQSLASALKRLRHPQNHKTLWVDALCINQEDKEEKNDQISRMSNIYNSAQHVCIWLGPEDGTSFKAISFIQRCLDFDIFDKMVLDPNAADDWAALLLLMRRPWFSRRWILQELAMAKDATLFCGKNSVSWRQFQDVVSQVPNRRAELNELFRQNNFLRNPTNHLGDLSDLGAIRLVNTADDLVQKSHDGQAIGHNFSLEALISSMSAFEATDPHDVIYAILWLANDAHPVASSSNTQAMHSERPGSPISSGVPAPIIVSSNSPRFSDTTSLSPTTETFQRISRTAGDAASSNLSHSVVPPAVAELPAIEVEAHCEVQEQREPFPKIDTSLESFPELLNSDEVHRSPGQISRTRSAKRPRTASPSLENRLESPTTTLAVPMLSLRRLSISQTNNPEEKKRIAFEMFRSGIEKGRFYVDYAKSVFQVCRDLVKFTTARSQSQPLDILCRPWAPTPPNNQDCLPSWILPLKSSQTFSATRAGAHRRINADPLLGKLEPGGPSYRASRAVPALCDFPKDRERALRVRGFRIDTIQQGRILPEARGGVIPVDWIEAVKWNPKAKLPPDDFWRTLCGNRNTVGKRPPSHWARACQDAFLRWHSGDMETQAVLEDNPPRSVKEYLERVQCVVWLRRLVRLVQPLQAPALCLCPKGVVAGDFVAILYGCSVPVVLRKVPQTTSSGPLLQQPNANSTSGPGRTEYELIGECYVNGMMDGEAHGVRSKAKARDEEFDEIFELT